MLGAFFLAMALYPEVQRKAQKELDAVVGTKRLPDFSDQPSLPYIAAIVKELLRWHPATPMGVPHRSLADDEYDGHIIPGGTVIFMNIWCVSQPWRRRLACLIDADHSTGPSCAIPSCTPNPTSSGRSVSWTLLGTWTSADGIPPTSRSALGGGKMPRPCIVTVHVR